MSALSTPEMSPIISPTRPRRLSSRRGSIAASDPWGTHNDINLNPGRTLTSKLTIVRVPQPEIEDAPRRHRRHGSNASLNSNSSKGDGGPSRMSFAFTSFTPVGGSPGRPASPSGGPGSPRLRPSSPSASRFGPTFPGQHRLSPEQLVDLARSSTHPRTPLPSPSIFSGNSSPLSAPAPTPVSFTPLPESIYLPFLDRASEVATLFSIQPNAKLFALLQQTFPPDARATLASDHAPSNATPDPRQWTFADLEHWLKRVDRDVADDVLWVQKARRCVVSHSELIWERMKGALGVPPELDVDDEGLALRDTAAPIPPQPTSAEGASISALESLDSDVFEPDSPISPVLNPGDEDSLVIEPVFANHTPPPSASDLTSSLTDLREVDETGEGEDPQEEPEIQGLRIVTSPSAPLNHVEVPAASPGASPVIRAALSNKLGDERDLPYDITRERGPGHPLFPSNFAQLSMEPTLRSSARANSMSFPPRSAYLSPQAIRAGVHRTTSIDAGSGKTGRMMRPEWARNWDPSKHEYAVTTASTAGSVGEPEH